MVRSMEQNNPCFKIGYYTSFMHFLSLLGIIDKSELIINISYAQKQSVQTE